MRLTRLGFTLVELLVASAIALAVLGLLATIFSIFSRTASDSQATVAMTSRMRTTASRLRLDLAGATARLRPPNAPADDRGYFEMVEGPATDFTRLLISISGTVATVTGTAMITGTDSILGDVDDVLLFTTRSLGDPFTGRYLNTATGSTTRIESKVAEVAWFCRPASMQPVPGLILQNLYRRQLLVAGYVGAVPFHNPFVATSGTSFPPPIAGSGTSNQLAATPSFSIPNVYNFFDLSLREDATAGGALVPNTLCDLTTRQNRFVPHVAVRASGTHAFRIGTTPYVTGSVAATSPGVIFDASSGREGEDIILPNVIAFDVRVYDPYIQPRANAGEFILPNQQGYLQLSSTTFLSGTIFPADGGFVDLGCLTGSGLSQSVDRTTTSGLTTLTGSGNFRSGLGKQSPLQAAVYDTWSTDFETNGIDNDGDSRPDQGTNGVDDSWPPLPTPPANPRIDLPGIADDAGEREVPPPYDSDLRAVEIIIRCYDPTSKQIRQCTVRHYFRD